MTHASWRASWIAAVTMGTALLAPLAVPAQAREHVQQALERTGADDDARGQTKLVLVRDDRAKLDVVVKKLDRKTTYEIVVDGVKVGTLTTNGGGNGRVRFSSRPRGRDHLLGFDPRGATVSIRSATGEDVLHTSLPSAHDATPGQGVCCVPDHGGDGAAECEDRDAATCAAAGGTVVAVDSCLPNPCATTPPAGGGDVVCCVPGGHDSASGAFEDDGTTETECEDRTPAECAAQGGTVVSATSCAANPCSPTPPPADLAACCIPDDSGAECEVLTAARCAARGGAASTATACTPDPCAAAPAGTPDAGTPATGSGYYGGAAGGDDHGGGAGQNGKGGNGGGGTGGHDDPAGHR